MNTYAGNISGFVIKPPTPETTGRKSSTLPKKLTHVVNQPQSQTLGFREAFKSKATIFGTLLRPKKHKTKSSSAESTLSKSPQLHIQCQNKGLNYIDGKLVSGYMPDLIQLLTPTFDYYPDSNFIFTFILCARLFMSPSRLLEQVYQLVHNSVTTNEEQKINILQNFVRLLVEWSDLFPCDFQSKDMMSEFKECVQLCTRNHIEFASRVNSITQHLVVKFQDLLQYIESSKEYDVQCDEQDKLLFDVCRDPMVMAQQLTILELEKLSQVNAEQFIERFIAGNLTCSRLDLMSNTTSSFELYVAWFNRLSFLIATEVSMCPKRKERVKLIDFFIDVGQMCFKIGNLNSLMVIIVGLNMNAVLRMKKTWQKSNESAFKKLELELSPAGNFRKYRETLQRRTKDLKTNDYVIPIFSILVKDIYFLNEGIKNKITTNLVNYEKFSQLSTQIKELEIFKNKTCTYKKDQGVINYLKNTPVCNEEGIYKSSFEVEPPESNFERDRYRSVRLKVGNR